MADPRRLVITTVVENYVDMLLADESKVTRAGLVHHFDPKELNPIGENGVALHVRVEWDRYAYNVLFDTGMSSTVLLHNASALGVDLGDVDHVVISHGHPDHYGGLLGFLNSRAAPVPVSIHPDAFEPRYLRLASGQVAPYYNHDLTLAAVEAADGAVVINHGPLEVGPGAMATGEIPRSVEFEKPASRIDTPNALIQIHAGRMAADAVNDDQALVLNVGSDGIVVLTGCSHAGVINTIHHAIATTGRSRVMGVFGGFHLGFPGTPESKTEATVEALREIGAELLCPMHCTGMQAMMRIRDAFPHEFLLNCTGTQVVIEA
jgi:7,8-dihydropterin-6-yl-methyl-4-(beta-D-ribofuranosyl)aminobenzene 5'-phosphate synthase